MVRIDMRQGPKLVSMQLRLRSSRIEPSPVVTRLASSEFPVVVRVDGRDISKLMSIKLGL
jgi:hypothetical protein